MPERPDTLNYAAAKKPGPRIGFWVILAVLSIIAYIAVSFVGMYIEGPDPMQ